ncbi:MAG: hypothetical protein D6735_04100, partial [Acidobacteria bacterium]
MKKRNKYYCLRLHIFFLIFSALIFSHFGQELIGWTWQNPLPQGNTLNSLRFAPDGRIGFAVGNNGTILKTEDGGFNFFLLNSPLTSNLYDIFVKNPDEAIAVGSRGMILRTSDGGKKWEQMQLESKAHLYGLAFPKNE